MNRDFVRQVQAHTQTCTILLITGLQPPCFSPGWMPFALSLPLTALIMSLPQFKLKELSLVFTPIHPRTREDKVLGLP